MMNVRFEMKLKSWHGMKASGSRQTARYQWRIEQLIERQPKNNENYTFQITTI